MPMSNGTQEDSYRNVFLFLGVGLLLAHYPMFFSGFAAVQNDPGDSRFNNFLLEYSYQFLVGNPYAARFWDMPIFYPFSNVTAFSDLLLGIAPPYWLFRFVGFEPLSSFQGWLLILSLLNYWVSYQFLRSVFSFSRRGASFGAFLFAFGGPRLARIAHQQMYAQFLPLLSLWGAIMMVKLALDRRKNEVRGWCILVFVSFIVQLYSGFYHGWFVGVLCALSFFLLLLSSEGRKRVWALLRGHMLFFVCCLGLTGALLYPLASHYLQTASLVGMRDIDAVLVYLPKLLNWFYMGEEHLLYGWAHRYFDLQHSAVQHEQVLFLGFGTSFVAFSGLWILRGSSLVRFILVLSLLIVVLLSALPGGIHLWAWVYWYVPGAEAIRAVSRLALYLLIPVAIGGAAWVDSSHRGMAKKYFVPLLLFVVLEQARVLESFTKEATLRNEDKLVVALLGKEKKCDAFYFSQVMGRFPAWRYHLDAMWASIRTGIPTINGHSGNVPPHWKLTEARIGSKAQDRLLAHALLDWSTHHELSPKQLCWVKRYRRTSENTSFQAKPCCRATTYFDGEKELYSLEDTKAERGAKDEPTGIGSSKLE